MKYFCWLQYYDEATLKQTNSVERLFHTGHQHGVEPKDKDWQWCLDDLVEKVNKERERKGHNLAPLEREDIAESADRCTRSER